jgi:hypothetical protein
MPSPSTGMQNVGIGKSLFECFYVAPMVVDDGGFFIPGPAVVNALDDIWPRIE